MKSVSIFTAAALLVAGAANAQTPTNQYTAGYKVVDASKTVPTNSNTPNSEVSGAPARGWSTKYTDYSQDSYVNQVGTGNTASVDQSDNRESKANGGSTAILNQMGDYNTATQKQTLTSTYYSNDEDQGRDFMKSTQLGSNSQSNQTQSGGGYNSAVVLQGAGTKNNRAIQTQYIDGNGLGAGNDATINQTRYSTVGGGSGNRAEQTQSGILQIAQIDQESSNSYAKQTQSGGAFNRAYIHQGDPGNANTAKQTQSGSSNAARIRQSVSSMANNNYAAQNQIGNSNQADIEQRSSKNYAEQQQQGSSNYASTLQENVQSASYITQNGMANSAIVHQH